MYEHTSTEISRELQFAGARIRTYDLSAHELYLPYSDFHLSHQLLVLLETCTLDPLELSLKQLIWPPATSPGARTSNRVGVQLFHLQPLKCIS